MTPLVLGLALVLAAPAPKKTDEPAPGKLEGDWVVESFEGAPKEATPPGSVTFRFADGKVSVTDTSRKGGKEPDIDYTADLTKKPATIDLMPPQGGPKGPQGPEIKIQGIIEIKGDTLKICFARNATERPTEFKGDPEKGVMLITLKRAKAEK